MAENVKRESSRRGRGGRYGEAKPSKGLGLFFAVCLAVVLVFAFASGWVKLPQFEVPQDTVRGALGPCHRLGSDACQQRPGQGLGVRDFDEGSLWLRRDGPDYSRCSRRPEDLVLQLA